MGAQSNKPIRAKLGESNSFYYDPDLKRWVNKKGGDTTPTPTATLPPPKATGPPRTASGPPTSGPTSAPRTGPPQRAVSEMTSGLSHSERAGTPPIPTASGSLAPLMMARSVSNGSVSGGPPAPGSSGPPSAPPSRPGTSMSNASSIDDLLGPPTTRKGAKGAAAKAKKKGRGYVDVMGDKAARS
jgi:hypothetical protein